MAPVTRTRTGRNGVQRLGLLIVDDHAPLRQAPRALIDGQENLEVIGEATNGRDAAEEAERLRPDVVLMDMVMPGRNGIEATRQIHTRAPSCRVLILTRKADQAVVIDGTTTVRVLSIDGDRVKLGIDAPAEIAVVRDELLREVADENQQAARTASGPALQDSLRSLGRAAGGSRRAD